MSGSLDLYRVFVAVAKHKSFSAAAQQLYITQPAVSQAIRQLEGDLGSQLFVRTSKGAVLTGSGEVLFGYAENALGILDTGQRRIEEMRSLTSGTLRIGGSDTVCAHYLLPYLSEFHRRHPNITISVTNRTSSETAQLLQQGLVDVGFVNLPLDLPGDIEVTELMPLQDCFVYGEKYFGRFRGEVAPIKDIGGMILLMLERQSATRRYLDQFFAQTGVRLKPQIELGSLDLLMEFAAAGLGIAAVPLQYATQYIESGKLRAVQVTPAIPLRHVGMISHKRVPLSFAARAFLELL